MAPGASRNVVVRYTPTARGADDADTGSFRVVSNDTTNGDVTIQLTGNGVAPDYMLSHTTLNYGARRVGSDTDLVVTLTNTGDDDATFSSATVTGNSACGDYSVIAGGGPGTVTANGGTHDITVRFTPSARGARNCPTSLVLTVEDPNDEAGTTTLAVGLTGSGLAPVYPTPTESDGDNDGTLDFGTTIVGVPVTRTVTVRNTGDDDASNVRAAIVGGNGCTQFTIISGGTSATLTSGNGERVITVRFLATSLGSFTCSPSLEIYGEDPDDENNTDFSIGNIQLSATAGSPDIAITGDPLTLGFGNVRVGSTSAAQDVVINNEGTAVLTVTSYTGPTAPYAISDHGGSAPSYTLNAAESRTVQLVCAPTARGTFNGTFVVNSNDPDEPTKTVNLTCTGIAPVPGVAPATHNFGNVPVGSNSATQAFTVSNTGDDPMTIESMTLTGAHANQFTIVGHTCGTLPTDLNPGSECQVDVRFNPTSFSAKTATLRVQTEATSGESARVNVDVALSGTGTNAPEITLLPSDTGPGAGPHLTRNFGNVAVGSFFDVFFEIRNDGTANLTGTVNAPTPNPPFSLVSGGGAFNLRPNATRRVTVRCRPTTQGNFTGTLNITMINDTDEPTKNVELNCTGAAPDIDVDPTNINFGNVKRNTQSVVRNVTIENEGSAPLTLTNVFISTNPAVFRVIRPAGCTRFPCTIQPGDSLVFGVQARPNRLGPIAGNLRITSNDPDEATVNVPLAVTGTLLALPASGDITTLEERFNVTDLQVTHSRATNLLEFKATGVGLLGVQVELYDLQGRKVAEAAAEGGILRLRLLTQDGAPLANGVYLYVITYRGPDGLAIRDRVEKLVIVR